MADVSDLADTHAVSGDVSGTRAARKKERVILMQRLEDAFAEAVAPFPDGSVPRDKLAYMLFLRAAERRRVLMPKGSFAVAKLLDGVTSQQKSFGLPPVMSESVEAFLRKNITYIEWVKLGWYKVFAYAPSTDIDVSWRKDSDAKKKKAQEDEKAGTKKAASAVERRTSRSPEEID